MSQSATIEPELLKIICCPETHQDVTPAEASLIASLNEKIAAGKLNNRGGKPVTEKLDGGLVRKDHKYLYPIRDGIPVMLIDESVAL